MEKQVVQQVLNELEAAGYVRRTTEMRHSGDGPLTPVYRVTDLGRAAVRAGDDVDGAVDDTFDQQQDGEGQLECWE